MQPQEIRLILDAARAAHAAGRAVALATVVRVIGSAYRREGAKMLVRDEGSIVCSISGGCLEGEVAAVAREVLASGTARRVRYDLAEDEVWGLGLGCGGEVEVRVEPLEAGSLLMRFLELSARGEEAALVTDLSDGGGRLLVHGSDVDGVLEPAHVRERALHEVRAELAKQAPRSARHADGGLEWFLDASGPPLELVLFGGGHDARPLAALGVSLGMRVTVVDPRGAFVTPEAFPGAARVLEHPAGLADAVRLGRRSHVVIMNHHLERDRATLRFALESSAPYVGVLGPRSRFERLLAGLAEEGWRPTEAMLARTRSPVGLDVGAEGPGEVALSVASEVLAASRGFGGGPLDGVAGRIHDPNERGS